MCNEKLIYVVLLPDDVRASSSRAWCMVAGVIQYGIVESIYLFI